jgi:hypothetical protein
VLNWTIGDILAGGFLVGLVVGLVTLAFLLGCLVGFSFGKENTPKRGGP